METEQWQRDLREYNKRKSTDCSSQYLPFDKLSDAAMAQYMIEEGIGKGQGDRLMLLLRSPIMNEAMNLRTVNDIRTRLARMPGGVRHPCP
jgi:hypothetical protein